MHPLTVIEQGEAFDLGKSLRGGHLPPRFSDSDPRAYLRSYVATYLQEEVAQEGLTRNIGHFTRFLETAAFSQGQTLNVSNVSREASISRAAAENYFSILEDLLIAVTLPVFSRHAKRKLITQRKFYFFDAGVFRAIRPVGLLAIEVKRTRNPANKGLRALREFKKDYPSARCFLFHGGATTLHLDGDIAALPVGEALRKLDKILNG